MLKKFVVISALFITSGVVLSYGYLTNLYDKNGGVTIKQYFVHHNGGVSLILNENLPHNPDNCNVTNHVFIKGDKPGHKLMVSAALAAFSSGKKIGLHSFGCEILPFWGGSQTRPTVSELWVFQ